MKAYFDHAAATPVLPEAVTAMQPYFADSFGNPSSIHGYGAGPLEALDRARQQVADLIGTTADRVVFTASATESNNLAVKGIAESLRDKRRHVVVSAIEHASVSNPTRSLAKAGFEVSEVGVDRHGVVTLSALEATLREDTALVAIQHASNEIGTIQNLPELAEVTHRRGALLHADGTAAVGRLRVDVEGLGVDSYAFTAQSFYGPKGTAALFLRKGVRPRALIEGGIQEKGRRAGTENIPGIVGMGAAAEIARQQLPEWQERLAALSRRLLGEVPKRLEHVVMTGHPVDRLPGHVSFCVEFVEGESMLLFLEDEGFAVASGSACTQKTLKASPVLLAIGLHHGIAQSSLMLTLGKDNTLAEVDAFLDRLPPIVERLRELSPLYAKFKKGDDPYATPDQARNGGH